MKFSKLQLLAGGLVLLAVSSAPLAAEMINPATKPQMAPMNAKEKKNLDMVLDWWRVVLMAGHTDMAPKYQAVDYIQHNPNIDTGRDAFVKFFASIRKPVNPIPAKLEPMPVVAGAKGDYVWLIWEHEAKDPRNPENTYHYNSFDILRIQNGKVQEHWDSAKKNDKSGAVKTGVSPKPPMEWNTGKLSKEEMASVAMATEELKDMLQYGHLELADKTMDPGYIQHNPNVPQGRDGFKQFMSRIPGRVPQEIKPEWKSAPVLTLANGPYVMMMWDRMDKDPADPNREYKWNHFDAIRVENGKIKEHWDEAMINPPRPGGKKQ
jgi:predicted SnoaL-like aldol condensation-catalyzing enzyme